MAKLKTAATGERKLDIQFMLAKFKAQILYSGFTFEYDEQDAMLTNFFNVLQNHNDFLKLLHTSEIQNSIFGKSYFYFDMLAGSIPKIGIYEPNAQNECLKIDGKEQIFIKGSRVVLSGANGIKAKIWEFRTPNSTKRLLQSGSSFNQTIPTGIGGEISTPEIVKGLLENNKIIKNDFTAMTAIEILNKDFYDFDFNGREIELSDDFAVRDLRDIINRKLNWIDAEIDLNHTRVIGDFANQDINQINKEYNASKKFNPWTKSTADNWIQENLILRSRGAEAGVEIQNETLNVGSYVDGLNKLLELYFQGCGLDYGLTLGSGQKTVAEVQTTYKTTYETIKATNQLRTKQLTKFIENIMIAYKLNPEEYKGKWKVKIMSEILNDQLQKPETILQLFTSRLMTEKHAIQTLNPNFSSFEVENYLKELNEEKEKDKKDNENFMNGYNINEAEKNANENTNNIELENKSNFNGE